ncbi:MAG: ABC transporter ATP-binding protein [Bacteroidetes bacterium]|nr:ABC transporter ATP-binding protein [Bacteroidota bacterium]
MSFILEIKNLSHSYFEQDTPCLHNINLSIQKGARFGIFGPNGAGKTTLMSIITGLIPFTKGNVYLQQHQVQQQHSKIKKVFGLVPQDFSFYPELSPTENMHFFGAWYGLNTLEIKQRTEELLQTLHLTNVKDKPIATFSGGMKRRVNLAIGLLHQPSILFLDEPTVGVDTQTRKIIIDYLLELNKKGTTLFYTSHQLHEAESLCTQVALIDQGTIIANQSLEHLLAQHQVRHLEELFLNLTGKAYQHQDV